MTGSEPICIRVMPKLQLGLVVDFHKCRKVAYICVLVCAEEGARGSAQQLHPLWHNTASNYSYWRTSIMPALKTLDDLFIHSLRDIYNAEKQLVKALPKMAKAANSEKLRAGFEEHLQQTEGHVERLETIFKSLDTASRGIKCKAMEGLVEEGSEMIEDDADPAVKDAGLIAAAQKVEHYEIATYGTLATFAELLGHNEAVELLQATLAEEKETDEKLTELAESEINVEAQR